MAKHKSFLFMPGELRKSAGIFDEHRGNCMEASVITFLHIFLYEGK